MTTIQREFEVVLPIGYTDETGRSHRRALIRKMRGHEEALLGDATLSAGRLATALIHGCLLRLGDLERPSAEVVAALYSADRNYLLVELRRISLGNELRESYVCPRCGAGVSVVQDLSQLEVRRLADGEQPGEIEFELEDGYVDRQGATHRAVTLTLPRGTDEDFVSPMVEQDPLRAADALLLRCIRRFGELPRAELEAYGAKILRDLTIGDRLRLRDVLDGQAPGVSFERSVPCGGCGTTFEGVMDVSGFFVPGGVETGSGERSSTSPITFTGPGPS